MSSKISKNQKRRLQLQSKISNKKNNKQEEDAFLNQAIAENKKLRPYNRRKSISSVNSNSTDTSNSTFHEATLSSAGSESITGFGRSLLEPKEKDSITVETFPDPYGPTGIRTETTVKIDNSLPSSLHNEVKTETNAETSTAAPATSTAAQMLSVDDIVQKAEYMYKTYKDYIKSHPEFKNEPDKRKLEFFRTRMNFDTFMNEFPIVSRYMICMGQYKTKAFRRFLDKVKRNQKNLPPPDKREKGFMEDLWVRNQADYVQYLWESYQKRHYNNAERQWIWQETYERLKGEFDDFRDMHKDIEERIKIEKKQLAAKNTRELLERIKTGKQNLTDDEEKFLLYELQNIAFKKMFSNTLKELLAITRKIEHTSEGTGTNTEKQQQKITMIETVDNNRMTEIDDKYKPTELVGMEPISEEDFAEMRAAEEREANETFAREQIMTS
jgi:hypothetical protein